MKQLFCYLNFPLYLGYKLLVPSTLLSALRLVASVDVQKVEKHLTETSTLYDFTSL